MRGATETGSAPQAARSSRSARGGGGRAEGEREGLAGEQSGGSVVIKISSHFIHGYGVNRNKTRKVVSEVRAWR
jgi:hypothetical protein